MPSRLVITGFAAIPAYDPYLLPGFVKTSSAAAWYASEGSVPLPGNPIEKRCFSNDAKKNKRSFMIGPPTEKPYCWLRFCFFVSEKGDFAANASLRTK